jgi:hypothetical protein
MKILLGDFNLEMKVYTKLVTIMELDKRNMYRLLVGKRPLGKPKHRWMDNIRMDLGEVGDVDWIGLAKDRNRWRAVVNSVLNLWVP